MSDVVDTSITRLQLDRTNPEAPQVRAHNSRVKLRYPEIWKVSTLTNAKLLSWVLDQPKTCPYHGLNPECTNQACEIDHKIPLSRPDAVHEISNLQYICQPCNRSKHDQTDEEFKATLHASEPKKPRAPSRVTLSDYGIDKNILRDSQTRPRTLSLFKETAGSTSGAYPVLFTLTGEEDTPEGLICVPRVYMELADPTEYRIANGLFCGLHHWKILCRSAWFQHYLHRWRRELKAKLRAQATEKVLCLAESTANGALQAIRMVLQEDTIFKSFLEEDEPKKKVGRPNKEKTEDTIPDETLAADLERTKN